MPIEEIVLRAVASKVAGEGLKMAKERIEGQPTTIQIKTKSKIEWRKREFSLAAAAPWFRHPTLIRVDKETKEKVINKLGEKSFKKKMIKFLAACIYFACKGERNKPNYRPGDKIEIDELQIFKKGNMKTEANREQLSECLEENMKTFDPFFKKSQIMFNRVEKDTRATTILNKTIGRDGYRSLSEKDFDEILRV